MTHRKSVFTQMYMLLVYLLMIASFSACHLKSAHEIVEVPVIPEDIMPLLNQVDEWHFYFDTDYLDVSSSIGVYDTRAQPPLRDPLLGHFSALPLQSILAQANNTICFIEKENTRHPFKETQRVSFTFPLNENDTAFTRIEVTVDEIGYVWWHAFSDDEDISQTILGLIPFEDAGDILAYAFSKP